MLSLFSSRSDAARGVGRLVVMLAALVALFAAVLSPAASAQQNEAPVAIAFARGSAEVNPSAVNPGDEVTLDGTLSFDPDGLPDGADLTYRWAAGSGFAWLPISDGGSGPTARFFVPPAGYGNDISITLTVTDSQGASSMQTVTVSYNNQPVFVPLGSGDDGVALDDADNRPPQPDMEDQTKLLVNTSPGTRGSGLKIAEDDMGDRFRMGGSADNSDDAIYSVGEGSTIQLTVRAVDAVDRTAVSYSWDQIHGTVPVTLTTAGSSATFTAPQVPPEDPMRPASVVGQTYEFAIRVTATDADGGSVRQVFYIEVTEVDVPPVANGGPNQDSALPNLRADTILVPLNAAGSTDSDPYDIPVTIPAASSPSGNRIDRNVDYTWRIARVETAAGVRSTDPLQTGPTGARVDVPNRAFIEELIAIQGEFTLMANTERRPGMPPNFVALVPMNQDPSMDSYTDNNEDGMRPRNVRMDMMNVNWYEPDVFLRMAAACDTDGDEDCDGDDDEADEHPLLGGSVYVEVTAWSAGDVRSRRSDTVEIRIAEDPNEIPVVEAAVVGSGGRLVNDDVSVFEGEPVSLTAVQTEDDNENDPDFDGLTYTWTQTDPTPSNAAGRPVASEPATGDRVCVNCAFGASPRVTTRDAVLEVVFTGEVTGLEIARPGRRARRDDFRFRLSVMDQYGVMGTSSNNDDVVTITVVEANEAPVVDAGDDQTVADGDEVILSASATDPDLSVEDSTETHTFAWTQTSGPEVDILDGGTASASFVAEGGAEEITLEFMVTVTDARGLSDSDTVTVTVAAAAEPEEPEPVDFPMVLEAGLQVAAEQLVASMPDRYAQLVALACDTAAGTASDSDTCATGELGSVPGVPADPDTFYSGPIDSATFCITFGAENNGLRLYAFDGDGDGVAETCVLPWSEREAAARQAALLQLGQEFNEAQGG